MERVEEYRSSSNMSHQSEVRVPIFKRETSVVEKEFGSIRERFDEEMRKMEDEMNRLRGEILEGNKRLESSFKETRSTTTRTTSSRSNFGDGMSGTEPGSEYRTELKQWMDNLDSPLISGHQDIAGEDGKCLRLRFDVSEYRPEEISVKTVDSKLKVHAKHEQKGDGKSVYREYNREFLLPKGTDPELIRSTLSKDGILTVEAPLPALPGPSEHRIPITNF
ncbi:heat shock protein beta-6-like [Paramacrobiotus metropolitanus]|uniref:heat shock protein beta-6-like n=1 Tax=Paramacrobiotus metropolitanus TaxID=2943436 RepID=UPI002445EEB2|nr:heat shock protein beta-6-like [Paramacrobiotus metropolitanus]